MYQALDKAKSIARFFKLSRRVPALTRRDICEIDRLFDLIRGREIPACGRIDNIVVLVNAEHVAAGLGAFRPDAPQLSLAGEADFPFLGQPVHVENCLRVIKNAKLITRTSDIKRLLKQPSEAIKLRFTTTTESQFAMKLAL